MVQKRDYLCRAGRSFSLQADFKAAAGLNPLHQSQPVKQFAHKREGGGFKGLPVKAGRHSTLFSGTRATGGGSNSSQRCEEITVSSSLGFEGPTSLWSYEAAG